MRDLKWLSSRFKRSAFSNELKEKFGVSAKVISKDLSVLTSSKEIFDELCQESIHIDILVNNAGFGDYGVFSETNLECELDMIQVNLVSLTHLTKLFLPTMLEQNYGKIINVTSVAGIVGTTGQINYAAAKGGLISFTKSCARELARYHVTANVISLGIVLTDMTRKLQEDPKLREIYMRRILLNRYAEPQDIAPAFVFLASDESNYITGQLLCVDGGYGLT